MSEATPTPAFEILNVLHVWPLSPGHVIRIARLLNLLDCVPILLRSKEENDAGAGIVLGGTLLTCHVVTNNWSGFVKTLTFVGKMEGRFGKEAAHWATAENWKYSKEFGAPAKWRAQIQNALDGPFFKNHVDLQLQARLAEIDSEHATDRVDMPAPKPWKERQKINIAFDLVDEFQKIANKNSHGCSQLAVDLGMDVWIKKLLSSRYRKDLIAGGYLSSAVPMAHAQSGEWERLCSTLEYVGALDVQGHEFISTAATHLRARYGHQRSMQVIPHQFHDRLHGALELPFFANNFDAKLYELETAAVNRYMATE